VVFIRVDTGPFWTEGAKIKMTFTSDISASVEFQAIRSRVTPIKLSNVRGIVLQELQCVAVSTLA